MARLEDYHWIEDREGLERLAASLAGRSEFDLDSESNSGFAYEERLCLLQINDGENLCLVDLLALPGDRLALEPLRPVLESNQHEIRLHGGEFDVGCLKRDYGISLRGVWDSQQAASFLGWEKTGFGSVVERICGVSLPKAHAHHDWSRRPIEGEVLEYALNDVRYLPEISARLKALVRAAELEEEVAIACRAVEESIWNGGFELTAVWSIKGARQLSKAAMPILVALYQWREGIAKQLDLPAGRTIHNQLLLALSRSAPASLSDLRRLGVPRRVTKRWAGDLLVLIAEAKRNPPPVPRQPVRESLSREAQQRGERLRKWRRQESARQGVPLQVVLPMVALKYIQRHGADDLSVVPQFGQKRIRLHGEILRQLVGLEGREKGDSQAAHDRRHAGEKTDDKDRRQSQQ